MKFKEQFTMILSKSEIVSKEILVYSFCHKTWNLLIKYFSFKEKASLKNELNRAALSFEKNVLPLRNET